MTKEQIDYLLGLQRDATRAELRFGDAMKAHDHARHSNTFTYVNMIQARNEAKVSLGALELFKRQLGL